MQRQLGPGLRALLAVIGAAALVMSVMVIAGAARRFQSPASRSTLYLVSVVLMSAVVFVGGTRLLRGAARGSIEVRRNRPASR